MESFNKPNKLNRIWDNEDKNKSDINKKLKTIDKNYRSINYFKNNGNIQIYKNELISGNFVKYTVHISDFPEYLVTLTKPHFVFSIPSAYNWDSEVSSFQEAYDAGKLHNGDLSVLFHDTAYWWFKTKDGYDFSFQFLISIKSAIIEELGFSSVDVPVYFDLNLYIVNEGYYNEIQSGK